MERILTGDSVKYLDQKIKVSGWVSARRDHGKLIFLDLRDRTSIVQLVLNPKVSEEAHATAEEIRNEFVIEAEGIVKKRASHLVNPNIETGTIEMEVTNLTILSRAKTLPFELEDTKKINEEARLKYRYLDLRSARMAKNIRLRHKVTILVREFLNKEGFVEIETPMLTKTSPEGARDFLVPSRLQPGKFYALPQAPQQYKQLLMIAGFEKYYQLARAMRDEDLRGDRQLEHTQIDMEMSFVKERDVLDVVENMFIKVVESLGKKSWKKPFPVFIHEEAVKKFGADKFDMRPENERDPNVFAFAWVVDFPLFEWSEEEKRYTFAHNPFSAPKKEFMQDLLDKKNIGDILTSQYDIVLNGWEIGAGSIRNHQPEALEAVFEIMGFEKERIGENFGHMLEAFSFGAPPHGGIAWGIDRLIALLNGEPNIREVMAFPKTGDARDLMMDGPSEISKEQLRELKIKTDK